MDRPSRGRLRSFAGARGNDEDAPIPAIRGAIIDPPESTVSGHSWRGGVARNRRVRSTRRMTASTKLGTYSLLNPDQSGHDRCD